MDEFEVAEFFAVGPAAREIDLPVEPVVERAAEMEIRGKKLLQGAAVVVDIGSGAD
jgi:hypothetical protein